MGMTYWRRGVAIALTLACALVEIDCKTIDSLPGLACNSDLDCFPNERCCGDCKLVAACASLDAGTDGGAAADAGLDGGADAGGRIFAATTAISNQQGKVLVVLVSTTARFCSAIQVASFTLSATAMMNYGGGDPCGAATPEMFFPNGSYSVSFGIHGHDVQAAEKLTTVDVTVSGGDATATANGTLLSP